MHERNGFWETARELARRLDLEQMIWRHHALGMLQAEINGHLRIHVWDPVLRAMPTSMRDVHDHRFDFRSAILVGELTDVSYAVGALRSGESACASMWSITHAKEQRPGEQHANRIADFVRTEVVSSFRHREGDTYSIKRRMFHTTQITGLCVTMIHRTGFDAGPARVLAPVGALEVMSGIVEQTLDWRIIRNRVIARAREALA